MEEQPIAPPIPLFRGFPGGSAVKNLPASAGDSLPTLKVDIGAGGSGNLVQYSCLEKPTDREAWQDMAHRAAKSQTQLKQLGMRVHMREL